MNTRYTVRMSAEDLETLQQFVERQFAGDNKQFLKSAQECIKNEPTKEGIDFDEEEQRILNEALEATGQSYNDFAKEAILSLAKKRLTEKSKLDSGDFKPGSTYKGMANNRLKTTIDSIISHNDACEHREDKFYINNGLLQRVCKANSASVNRYLDTRKDEIEAHHNRHSLTPSDNRKGKRGEGYDIVSDVLGKIGMTI